MKKDITNIEEIKKPEVFKVPEDYFNNLTDRIMSNIPAEETNVISINKGKKTSVWMKWTSVAACATVALVGAIAYMNNHNSGFENGVNELVAITEEQEYQEDVIEYSMLDEHDVYSYLSGEAY